jgi:CheY-like chemotaxis protein
MSRASRLFRPRANRGLNSSPRPAPVEPSFDSPNIAPNSISPDTSGETDAHERLAALYPSSVATSSNESRANSLPVELDPDEPSATSDGRHVNRGVLLAFPASALNDEVDLSDPLAILLQTIDSTHHYQNSSSSAFAQPANQPLQTCACGKSLLATSSSENRASSHARPALRATAPFLTETMDLEAIAAAARESSSDAAKLSCTSDGASDSAAYEAVKENAVAEMSAAAEEFVAEQRHHAPAAALHANSHSTSSASLAAHTARSLAGERGQDRRRKRRALISAPIRVRGINAADGTDEVATTFDVSRSGILFHTQLDCYFRDMQLAVVFPYTKSSTEVQTEQKGHVVRVDDLGQGTFAVAIELAIHTPERALAPARQMPSSEDSADLSTSAAKETKKPLVLVMDADASLRDTQKTYLQNEGYDVIAVSNFDDALESLERVTPSLIIAEIEGEGLPGYGLCNHVKSNFKWKHIPVVLTTCSAYPSDYSQAHSVGAIVCMAKPYKQERLGHVVRLLSPLPEHLQNVVAPHTADPTRVPGRDCNARNAATERKNGAAKSFIGKIRLKFSSSR